MTSNYPIQCALISVFDKNNVVTFGRFLQENQVKILSTGGTANHLRRAGLVITEIEEYTGFPEILEGRVKSLHPCVHGGILAKRNQETHQHAVTEHGMEYIDLVVVNLYPFTQTVAKAADFASCLEMVDIGGPALIRSGAKAHDFVTVVVDPQDYPKIMEYMAQHQNTIPLKLRRELACKAFYHCAVYDAAIAQWMSSSLGEMFPPELVITGKKQLRLRYGENPHQQAALYAYPTQPSASSIVTAKHIQGKELSYNNIQDAEQAACLVAQYDKPTVVFVKHGNPCGVATSSTLLQAYENALACDPVSAYGGIVAFNRPIDKDITTAITQLFLEVILAPDIQESARSVLLKAKKSLRVLLTDSTTAVHCPPYLYHSITGGFLVQTPDTKPLSDQNWSVVSKRKPTQEDMQDLKFAWTVVRHVKSNAIVCARDGATIGIGAGQTSRVESVCLACSKAQRILKKQNLGGFVVASDAFFPFADGIIQAAKAGATAVIHSGGSIRDQEVIDAADTYNLSMVLTHTRHFRH